MNGEGVALGRSVLVADALARGDLVRPFSASIPSAYSYYLVCAEPLSDDSVVAAFRAWMTMQVGAQAAAC
jgi:LysR family glycine cleavage system transcriptional activator